MNAMTDPNAARKDWMSLLAKSPASAVDALWKALGSTPDFELLRAPEVGGVMVRGRAGATGAPFNLGEMTVTRASVTLRCGTHGHGYVQGRDRTHAQQAALIDALMQTQAAGQIDAEILMPLREAQHARKSQRAAKAAKTKVDFFTMARGED